MTEQVRNILFKRIHAKKLLGILALPILVINLAILVVPNHLAMYIMLIPFLIIFGMTVSFLLLHRQQDITYRDYIVYLEKTTIYMKDMVMFSILKIKSFMYIIAKYMIIGYILFYILEFSITHDYLTNKDVIKWIAVSQIVFNSVSIILCMFLLFAFLYGCLKFIQIDSYKSLLLEVLNDLKNLGVQIKYTHHQGRCYLDVDYMLNQLLEMGALNNVDDVKNVYLKLKTNYKLFNQMEIRPFQNQTFLEKILCQVIRNKVH
ncbi:hypothetical protein [Parageobacillus thermoglucosidasius]|uniref:Uncharacterized protein n=1 Tax=Parageobacillus thermoglucosidasius TaxID=1426 RepID=A0AB38R6D3_PARTM|nr:hypothetical protein [Parageobacillus thermoglucosidasius]UOE78425.1 hypothetical protein IMI45_20220 [Parageobacillus thermoglucosidasius]